MTTATPIRITQETTDRPALFLAFELGANQWKLGFTTGAAQRPRERNVPARNIEAVREEIRKAKQRFGLPEEAPVISCYEAGRDGFWLHRWLVTQGVANCVVDSASIEVNRRHRRAKTDRLDVQKLLTMLLRHAAGERKVWSIVRVPSVEEEDRRQLHRALATAKQDRTRVINRIKGLLASHGLVMPPSGDFPQQLEHLRLWDGTPLPVGLRHRLDQEWEHVQALAQRIAQLEAERRAVLQTAEDAVTKKVQQLLMLKGIGINSAWVFVMEFFGWRAFRNRKEVGALSGLTPTPYASGNTAYERGIAKAGNAHVRAMAIEIAWGWLRFQPESALTQWYQQRFGHGSSRLRRIGIVALARKLLIALWRFVETGVLPDGAALKGAVRIYPSRR
jgi:transposase